jgi:hypothetical protein
LPFCEWIGIHIHRNIPLNTQIYMCVIPMGTNYFATAERSFLQPSHWMISRPRNIEPSSIICRSSGIAERGQLVETFRPFFLSDGIFPTRLIASTNFLPNCLALHLSIQCCTPKATTITTMMADIEPDLHPASTSSTDYEVANIADNDGEYQVEQIISDRLMRGYTLLAGACPVCSTPLIKNEREKARSTTDESVFNDPKNKFPIVVSSESFEQPFIPVIGVPFCVICHSHVVTSAEDVDLLETSESFKEKGSILVAMQDDERREEMENTASGEDTAQHAEHQEQHPVEGDDSSEMDANSFNKSISSIMKESESVVGRPPMVDPNRFSTALFCGTTASRQMVSSSPVNVEGEEADEKSQVPDPYNDMRHGGGFDGPVVEQEFEGSAFADALEEVDEDEDAAAVAVDLKEMITDFTLTVDISAPPILDNDEEEKKEEKMYEETYKDTYEEEDEDEEDGADVMMIEYSVR